MSVVRESRKYHYRKIYEEYYQCSLLPGVEIHHIDGDHTNDDPLNLQAVSLQEHYDIHYLQGDYNAARLIGSRIGINLSIYHSLFVQNGKKVALQNMENGVGLIHWAKNNPEEYKDAQKRGGKIGGKLVFEQGLGIHSLPKERKIEISSQGGKKAAELGLGFKAGHASSAGKIGGKKGGEYAKKNRTGIFALTPEQIKAKNQKAAITKLIKNGKASAWPRKETI